MRTLFCNQLFVSFLIPLEEWSIKPIMTKTKIDGFIYFTNICLIQVFLKYIKFLFNSEQL